MKTFRRFANYVNDNEATVAAGVFAITILGMTAVAITAGIRALLV